jgi:2,3-diaminopropionate biosynthesis protein SbnA
VSKGAQSSEIDQSEHAKTSGRPPLAIQEMVGCPLNSSLSGRTPRENHLIRRQAITQFNKLLDRLELCERVLRPTPVVRLANHRLELHAKLEFMNGVGSIKDRPAFWILKHAIERGEVGPNTTIIESSSGNFACALATFSKILALKFIPVVDPLISPLYESFLRSCCETVVKVDKSDTAGGYLKTRLETVRSLRAQIPDSYWPNQYANCDGMDAHYRLTAGEICQAVASPDYVFLGVSSCGTIAGVSRRIKEMSPRTRIVAVDAEGSVIFGHAPKKRLIPGIGASISPPLLENAVIDDIVIVPESETIVGCHRLLKEHSLFVGGSTGTVFSAIERYFSVHRHRTNPSVLFLCCDRGTAYLHNIYNPTWLATHSFLPESQRSAA